MFHVFLFFKFVRYPNSMYSYFRVLIFCLSWCVLAAIDVEAQEQYKFFYGKVIDQATDRTLANVNLFVRGTRTGTVTGKKGDFSFFTDSIPATLVVSHVGYLTKEILLDETSFSLNIYLLPQVKELAGVEITAIQNEVFFRDEHYAVRDYEIDSGLVYLLVFRTRLLNAELICMNTNGDTVSQTEVLRFMPNRLFRDCMGYMHLLSNDSGFQVYRAGKGLELVHPVALKKFDDVLKNCVASTSEIFYFQKVVDHGLSVEYYGINRKTLARNTISSVKDEKRLKMLRRNEGDAGLLWMTRPPIGREDFVDWNYIHKIIYRPIKTALYRIGNYICIFNTPDRQMEFYDKEGNYSYKLALQIDGVDDGRWTSEILYDDFTGRVYTMFLKNGVCSLYRVDLNTGALKKVLSMLYPFPQKVRVYQGFVYYLYDIPGSPDNKLLYRQRL